MEKFGEFMPQKNFTVRQDALTRESGTKIYRAH